MSKNFRKFGIIALLIIFLAVTVSAKFSWSGLMNFMELAEGKATIIIIVSILSALLGVIDGLFGVSAISLAKFNPQLTGPNADPAILAVVNSFIKLLMPFYILAIILTGLYLLFASSSPAGRAKAKGIFWRLILSIVLVPLSLPLFQIILNVSAALTSGIANIMNLNILYVLLPFNLFLGAIIGSFSSDPTLLIIIGAWMLIFNLLIGIILAARYVILLILAMLFPITIFLWYLDFPLTRAFGMNLMRWTFMWAFMSVVFVLVAGASQIAMSNYLDRCSVISKLGITITTPIAVIMKILSKTLIGGIAGIGGIIVFLADIDCGMTIFLSLAGTLLMIAVPFMMIGLLKWIGGAMVMYGLTQFRKPYGELFTLAGGIIAGMGPGAVIMYGTQTAFRKATYATLPAGKTKGDIINAALGKDTVPRRILGVGRSRFGEYEELMDMERRGVLPTSKLGRFNELKKEVMDIDEFKKLRIQKSNFEEYEELMDMEKGGVLPTSKLGKFNELKKEIDLRIKKGLPPDLSPDEGSRLTELEGKFGSDRVRRLDVYDERIKSFTEQYKEGRLKITGPLTEEELVKLDGLRAKAEIKPSEKAELDTLKDKIGDKGLKKLDEYDNYHALVARRVSEDFDRWEVMDALKKGGIFPELGRKAGGSLKKAGGEVKKGVGRRIGYIRKIRRPPATPP